MKYWLKDFEHNISPSTWEAAELLSQSGGVRNLREIETHFWVARVDAEDASYETEVIITPHKIKAYSCECFSPGRRLMCAHVAASLLKIRQFLDQRAEERRAKSAAAAPSEPSRITVQSVLENATASELETFVRDYARRDRDFALALKTWFAGSITESENPYALLLDSVFPKSGPAKGCRDPDFRRIRKALDGLEQQIWTAAGEGNYRGVYQMAAAILLKTLPTLDKSEGNRREALLHFCRLALQKISEMPELPISAELRDGAWKLAFELGMRSAFPPEMQRDALGFLAARATESEKSDGIQGAFQEAAHPAPDFLLQLYLILLSRKKMPEAAPRVLEDYVSHPETIHAALLMLYYLKEWTAVQTAGKYFLDKLIFSAKQQREIEDILLYVAEQSGDRRLLTDLLQQRFVKTGHLETFRKLRDAADTHWTQVYADMLQSLSARKEIQALAAALAAGNQTEDLAQLLEKERDISLLQRYESNFFNHNSDFLRALYESLLSQYLEEHFGAPAATYVRRQLAELSQKGQSELALQIAGDLLRRFPDRPSLPEELSELFPKSKRKSLPGVG